MLFGFEDPTNAEPERVREEEAATAAAPPTSPSPNPSRWRSTLLGMGVGLAVGLGAWALWPSPQQLTQQDVDAAIDNAVANQTDPTSIAAAVFDQIAPSLVVVSADATSTSQRAIGGGVVINESGQILTANHVVADAASIQVTLADGSVATAVVRTADATLDIAILEAQDATGALVPAVIGNSRTLRVGDPIFAIGNPLGLTGSLSAGVISGIGRSVPLPSTDQDANTANGSESVGEPGLLEDLIQFDAAVNRGSSGGPLVNSNGQVIGIVTALADPGGQGFFTGIGFAVPIDIAVGRAADGPSQ